MLATTATLMIMCNVVCSIDLSCAVFVLCRLSGAIMGKLGYKYWRITKRQQSFTWRNASCITQFLFLDEVLADLLVSVVVTGVPLFPLRGSALAKFHRPDSPTCHTAFLKNQNQKPEVEFAKSCGGVDRHTSMLAMINHRKRRRTKIII
jgi:hypothetical protein